MANAFDLQEELQALQDTVNYLIENKHDIHSMEPAEMDSLLQQAVSAIAVSSEAVSSQDVFDILRSFLKCADAVPGILMSKLLDVIMSGFAAEVDAAAHDVDHEDQQACAAHKTPIEMYAFLLNWSARSAEKVNGPDEDAPAPVLPKPRKGRGGKAAQTRTASKNKAPEWSWKDQVVPVLTLISKVLKLKTSKIWTRHLCPSPSPPPDNFYRCLTAPAYHITENEQYMKSQPIKLGIYKVICLAVKHHGHGPAAQTTIIQSLQYYEHLSEPMAECLNVLLKEFDHAQLGDEILREIAAKSFSAQDTKGPRNFSRFLTQFAEWAPRAVLKQISLLLSHLDSESYPMRMAIVEVIGCLIRELACSEDLTSDAHQTQKQLNGLYDLLLERVLDLSSYVRSKVFTVLSRLCDLPVKFPKQRLAITRAAVSALEDKVAGVRKNAISLIVKLMVTHPYGLMHGGLLGVQEWEDRYRDVTKDLQKTEKALDDTLAGADAEGTDKEDEQEADGGVDEEPSTAQLKKKRSRHQKEDAEGVMDVDEEDVDEEEADSIMDEDEPEPSGPEEGDGSGDVDGEGTSSLKHKSKSKKNGRKSELAMAALTDEQAALAALESNQLLHLRLRKRYYAEALSFIRQVEEATQIIFQLLGSTHKAEVLEAMEFFRVAHEYQLDSAEIGIKKMLHLIWSKDNSSMSEDGKELKGVRSRLLDPKQQVNRIAKNMVELTYDATLAELTSLEEMMRYMMDDDQIHADVVNKLWQVYSSERPLPKQQRRGAIIIIGMLALARRGVVQDRVDILLKIGLGPMGKADLILAKYTCVALQRLNGSAKKVKGSLLDKSVRLEMDSAVFRKLQEAIEHPCRSREWFALAEQAINTVYALGDRPEVLSNTIIRNLTRRAFRRREKSATPVPGERASLSLSSEQDPEGMDEDPPQSSLALISTLPGSAQGTSEGNPAKRSDDTGDAFELSQLLFVVGHVAIKHIVYLELVEREWKRQKQEKELAEKLARGAGDDAANKDVEELDQVAGNAEDEIGDRIAAVRETELLYGPDSLLALYGPLLVRICGRPDQFKNTTLRSVATLSFSKFLCVSSQFCDSNHHLLFRILETSKDPNIRSNIAIALGDIAVSFSTIIDENSDELYKGLSDSDLVVKKNTLMVLTHLILNGMIKVKGQLGEMAKCLEDDESRIADLAKLFFTDLSTKDNAIYNNLPDVISHLSVGEHALDEEGFQRTMRYIFTFIEKERQAESIVEKLCQRFRLSEDTRQWRDISFCLSLLPFKSERSVKKLVEGLPFYPNVTPKARSNKAANKPDSELNEFETVLEESRRQGAEDQAFEKRVEGKKAAAKKRATRRTARKRQPSADEDDE
ncbi:non-SMC mitotic condensation complex subunit 1-domain-containing protein [Multifurca ochricompacta]|uniref:Condensin complex subunit 1 n=1 Tax=Multifurca ochricompacta TaxID=376703 RepID=A0AAD4M2A2_9AGAM|nr:non-SMC mitotic condensation complex subunit 1-domain-containing protein [Multifurca ochricompacta]